jgi:hypothetical protein
MGSPVESAVDAQFGDGNPLLNASSGADLVAVHRLSGHGASALNHVIAKRLAGRGKPRRSRRVPGL